jgi:hypothetical protein
VKSIRHVAWGSGIHLGFYGEIQKKGDISKDLHVEDKTAPKSILQKQDEVTWIEFANARSCRLGN